MNKSLLNKRARISASFVCVVIIFIGFGITKHTPMTLDLNHSTDNNANKPVEFEKTVSKESIHKLFNTAELSAEEAAIFHASLPQSLADSPPPSPLDTNAQGELIINMKVKRLFEFYLSAMGEDTLAECILRIRHALTQQLSGNALATGLQLLEGFLQYQNHIGEIKNDFSARYDGQTYSLERVKEMKQNVRESRSLFFTQEASRAFYKKEDEYDDYMIKKVAIRSNRDLTDDEKQAEYEQLNHESPAWISQQEHQASLVSNVQAQEKALRENGADATTIHQLRVDHYGEEAAQNLADLDQKRAHWSSRVSQYRLESKPILMNSNYTQAEKDQLLQDIRQQHFSGSELIRISALDKIVANQLK